MQLLRSGAKPRVSLHGLSPLTPRGEVKILVEHNLGQSKTVDKSDWILACLAGLIDSRLRKMASRDNSALGEWLQAAAQLGDLFSPDRVEPTLRLHLD